MYFKKIKKFICVTSLCVAFGINTVGCAQTVNSNISIENSSESSTASTSDSVTTDSSGNSSNEYSTEDATYLSIDTESDDEIKITKSGTYVLSGTATDKQILVDSSKDDDIILILNGINLTNSSNAPIVISKSGSATLVLADGSDNYIIDNRDAKDDADEDSDSSDSSQYNSAIYSKCSLTIDGNGSLSVTGGYNDAIASKDDLSILSGILNIDSYDDGIIGKDSVIISGGSITVSCADDCIKSTNEDAEKGTIQIDGGILSLTSTEGHGLTAVNSITINDGDIDVVNSFEGMESTDITINDGTIDIYSSDDGINISSSTSDANDQSWWDDKAKTPKDTTSDDNTMPTPPTDTDFSNMPDFSNDGTRPTPPTDIDFSSDDTRPAPPTDGSPQDFEFDGEKPDMTNFTGKGNGGGGFMMEGDGIDGTLTINGGTITIDAGGDGLDSNGDILITGGYTMVSGSVDGGNAALDYATGCTQTGGVLILSGNRSMATYISDESTVTMINGSSESNIEAGTEISLVDASGNTVYTWTIAKKANYLQVAAPDIDADTSYSFKYNGESIEATTEQNAGMFGGFGGPGKFGQDINKDNTDSEN